MEYSCSIGDSSNSSEDAGNAPDDSPGSTKAASRRLSSSDTASAPAPKKSRRSADNKRVVTFSISELDGSRPKSVTGGDGAPPSDSWSWRKYGQKPIKGSPYPRGYYRCSSSKGCPARKQVERSRVDPTMLVVTYSSDHNHNWPLPKHRISPAASKRPPSPPKVEEEEEEEDLSRVVQSSPDPANSSDKFSDLISEEPSEYCWFSEVGSGASVASPSTPTDDLLLGSIAEASASLYMVFPDELLFGGGGGDEDDSLFKDLGELPEYSVVFRRSYLDRQMLAEEEEEEEESRRPL